MSDINNINKIKQGFQRDEGRRNQTTNSEEKVYLSMSIDQLQMLQITPNESFEDALYSTD
jgi:hypothetical protein